MSARKGRKVHTETVRVLLCWSHYKFRQHLIAKSELFSDCKVIECDESYTCKTCGYSGVINNKMEVVMCLRANKKIVNKS